MTNRTFVFEHLQTELENLKSQLNISINPEQMQLEIHWITVEIELAKNSGFRYMSQQFLELQPDCDVEIGDLVRMKSNWGTSHSPIIMKTKTIATNSNGTRFPIRFDHRFKSLPRDIWDATQYQLFAAYNPKCKQCGERFDVDETARVFGKDFTENRPGFCSARCFTKHTTGI